MFYGIELNQIYLFFILTGSVVLLFTEWIRIDLTAILMASVFVLNGALYHTGLSERLGNLIKQLAGKSLERAIAVVMPSVALLSAFTHHVTITGLMLPPMLKFSRENNIPSSKLLMPLSFAASLGTAITIIGAPAFLIADGLLKQAGGNGLGIFSIAPIGLTISLAGTIFFLLLGRLLLPAHRGDEQSVDHFRMEGYYTELVLLPDSRLIGKTIREIEELQPADFKVSAWYRNQRR